MPDHLADAKFAPPGKLALVFADGRSFMLPVIQLEIPVDRMNWEPVMAAPCGEKMTITGIKGDEVPIDSSTLRYLVDKEYAAKIDAKLKSLQFSDEELARVIRDNPSPSEWFEQPSRDLTRDSWK